MRVFPSTSTTLLQTLAAKNTGVSEAAWARFFELYTPAMRRFIEMNDHTHDPDDVIQDVYVSLVDILENNRYDAGKSRFRTFLAMLIRRKLVSLYRSEEARGRGANRSLEVLRESGELDSADVPCQLTVPARQVDDIDLSWARAKHEAAVEHVLTKTALSVQTKSVYRAYVIEARPIDEVERKFGVSRDVIYKIKFRVDSAIAVIEEEYVDENAETPPGN
ncbi:MAG: sigma-70 family RNA polymerase sigma factor [Kiritimatiellae bacterium]|nr:sigma-70 family RNA polymerase sigma factor [Kiritimatiellia bacterium]